MILQFLNSHMTKSIAKSLKPRKLPVQERAGETIEAIFEATIQVLLKDGVKKLTTTRVAERAGVSVGSLYQYFPNKEALLVAMLERHLELIGVAAEVACRKCHGLPIEQMLEHLIDAFVDAKMKKRDISLAIAELLTEVTCVPRYQEVITQLKIEITSMLKTLPGVREEKISFVTELMLSTIGGGTRFVMENGAQPQMIIELKHSLKIMLQALLERELFS